MIAAARDEDGLLDDGASAVAVRNVSAVSSRASAVLEDVGVGERLRVLRHAADRLAERNAVAEGFAELHLDVAHRQIHLADVLLAGGCLVVREEAVDGVARAAARLLRAPGRSA